MEPETKRPSMKDRQRQMREDAILDAAQELLKRKGYTAMTLDDVIAEVGISKPTLYVHFASKEELMVNVILRTIREAQERLKTLAASLPPVQVLHGMMDWLIDQRFGKSACYYDLAGVVSLFAHESIRKADRELARELVKLVDLGQREGQLKSGVPPELVAQTMLSIVKDASYEESLQAGSLGLPALKTGIARLLLD